MPAPKGNNNAGRGREVTKALYKALSLRSEGVSVSDAPMTDHYRTLVEIWDVQIGKALEHDNQSAQMIMDRLEGKPAQQMNIEADVTTRNAKELTEEELINLAAGSS